MSIDNKIVKMKFDNAQFEANVSKSMSTLDKLKEKLTFKDSSKALDDWQSKINNVNFTAIEDSLKFLQSRFSATGEFVYKIWDKITDKGIAAFKQLESATVGQIKSGGWTRAMNLANAQFQVEGLKYSWEKIFSAADYGVTDTAYGLDSAAKAASQLAASGIDFQKVIKTVDGVGLTQMHKSLRAISGLAAMTNSSFDDIANVFTRIAGTGRVFAIDLNSIAARGINATATLAKHLHTTEADIKEMVKKGQISFATFAEAMDDAYGAHAKEANATFTGSMSNMKAALSRIGAIFAQPVINKTNKFFNAITSKIKAVQKSLQDVTKTNEKTKKSYTEQTRFAGHFAETYEKAVEVAVKVIEKLDMTWFQDVANKMDSSVMKIKAALDYLDKFFGDNNKETEKAAKDQKKSLKNMVATQEEYEAAMTILFKDRTLTGKKRRKWLQDQGLDPDRVQTYIDSVVKAKYNVEKASIKVEKSNNKIVASAISTEEALKKLPISIAEFNSMGAAGQEEFLKKNKSLTFAYRNHAEWLKQIKERQDYATRSAYAFNIVSQEYAKLNGKDLKGNEKLFDIGAMTPKQKEDVFRNYPQLIKVYQEAYDTPKNFTSFGNIFKNLGTVTSSIVTNIKIIVDTAKRAFSHVFNFTDAVSGVERFTGKLANLAKSLIISADLSTKMYKVFVVFFKGLKFGITTIAHAVEKIMDFVAGLFKAEEGVSKAGKSAEKTEGFFRSLFKILKKIGSGLWDYISNIDTLFKKLGQNNGIIRLKDALSKLFHTTKNGINDTVEPARGAFARFADSFEMPSIDDVANAIGWIADKIAIIIEKIPEWSAKVAGFFIFIVDKVKEFIGDIEFADIGGHIKQGIIDAFTIDDQEEKSIANFFTNIKNAIVRFFTETDWSKVGDVGKFGLVILTLVEVIRTLHNAGSMLRGISQMFSGFNNITKSIGKAIKGFTLGFDIASFGFMFAGIGVMMLGIAGVLYAINKMDEKKMEDAVTIVIILAGAVVAITAITAGIRKKANGPDNSNNVTGLFNNLKVQIGMLGQLAMFLVSVGVMLKFMTAAMKEFAAFDSEAMIKGFAGTIGSVATLLIFAAIIVKILQNRGKQVKLMESAGGIFAGLGVFFILAGLAMKQIADAMVKMDDIDDKGFLYGIATLSIMLGGMALLIKACSKLKPGAAWGAAAIMAVFGLAMSTMLVKIAFLGFLGWDRVLPGLAAVAGTMLTLSAFVLAVGAAVKKVGKTGNKQLIFTILALGATVYMIAEALVDVFNTLKGESMGDKWTSMGAALIPIVVIMVGMITMLGLMVHMLNTSLDKSKASKGRGKVDADDILEVAASFLIMAVAVGIISKAISMLSGIKPNTKALVTLGIILAIFTGLGALAGAKGQFAAGIMAVGTAFLLLGIGLAALGAAIVIAGIGLPPFAAGLEKLFDVIERHKVVALIVLAAFVASVFLLIKALKGISGVIMIVAKPLSGLINAIGDLGGKIAGGIKGVLMELHKGGGKIVEWFKALSPKMKVIIVTLVTTLLATAIQLAPKVIDTIISILFIIIDKIIQYADAIALKLVILLLKIIVALANAINKSAGAIANALLAVAKTLLKLGVVVLSKLLRALFNAIGNLVGKWFPTVGKWIKGIGNGIGDGLEGIGKSLTAGIQEAIDDTNTELGELNTSVATTTGSITDQGVELDALRTKLGLTTGATNDAAAAQDRYREALEKGQAHSVQWYRDYAEEKGEKTWFQEEYNEMQKYTDLLNERAEYEEKLRSYKDKRGKGKSESQIETDLAAWDLSHNMVAARQASEKFSSYLNIFEKDKEIRDLILEEVAQTYSGLFAKDLDVSKYGTPEWDFLIAREPEILNMMYKDMMDIMPDYLALQGKLEESNKNIEKSTYLTDENLKGARNSLEDLGTQKAYALLDALGQEYGVKTVEARTSFINAAGKVLGNILSDGTISDEILPYFVHSLLDAEGFEADTTIPDSIKGWVDNEGSAAINLAMKEIDAMFKLQAKTGISYDTIQEAFNRVPQKYIGMLLEAISDPANFNTDSTIPDDVKNNINSIVEKLFSEGVSSSKDELSFAEARNVMNGAISDYISYMNEASKEQLSNGMVDVQSNIYNAMANRMKEAAGVVESDDKVKEDISNAMANRMYQASVDTARKIEQENVFGPIANTVKSEMEDASNYGIEGFIGPLEDTYNRNRLVIASTKFISTLPESARAVLRERSPSKVMETIGSFATEGLIIGLKDKASGLKDTATEMISGLVSQFSEGGTDVTSAFTSMLGGNGGDLLSAVSGGYQFDMGIQPVLDTSSIMNGTDSIGSMLGNQSLMIDGFSGQLAADITSLDSRNSQGVNEIRQLRNEMSEMSSAIQSMRIYLDTGALVGGIVDPMDNRLGARAIYARRGN